MSYPSYPAYLFKELFKCYFAIIVIMTKFHVKVIFWNPKSLLCILSSLQRPLCVIGRLGKSKRAGQLCIHDVFIQSIFFLYRAHMHGVFGMFCVVEFHG